MKHVLVTNWTDDTNLTFRQFTRYIYCTFTDTEPTYTTSNDIQYYRDTISIVTCFHTIIILSKFHYRPALLVVKANQVVLHYMKG